MTPQTKFRPEQVHPSVYLAAGARVVGDVTLGEDSSVWFNAVLRGDIEAIRVGRRTNIQDNAVLHADEGMPCVIGDDVTIGHGAIVHGCQIGDRVLIGMNAVVMNGAKVGSDVIIGVGAVVTEGVEIRSGALVLGLPARTLRDLTAEEREQLLQASRHYVENARAFKT